MQEFWKLDFDKTTYSYNYTTTTGSSTLDKLHKILTIVLFAVDGAGVVLNVVVFFVLLQLRRRSLLAPMPHLMLGQQAFWDTSALALAIFSSVDPFDTLLNANSSDLLHGFVCAVIYSQAIYFMAFTFSVYNHILLGFERLCAIIFPLKYSQLKRRFWIVLIIYYIAIGFYTVPGFFRKHYNPAINSCITTQNVNDYSVNLVEWYDVSTFVVFYLIPLASLGCCTTTVVLRLRADSRSLTRLSWNSNTTSGSDYAHSSGPNKALQASEALVRVSIVQALLFVLCTSFANVFLLLSALAIIRIVLFSPLGDLTILSTNVNMALDPIVYFTFLPALRARLIALFRGHNKL